MQLIRKDQARDLIPNSPVYVGFWSNKRIVWGEFRRRDALRLIEDAQTVSRLEDLLSLDMGEGKTNLQMQIDRGA